MKTCNAHPLLRSPRSLPFAAALLMAPVFKGTSQLGHVRRQADGNRRGRSHEIRMVESARVYLFETAHGGGASRRMGSGGEPAFNSAPPGLVSRHPARQAMQSPSPGTPRGIRPERASFRRSSKRAMRRYSIAKARWRAWRSADAAPSGAVGESGTRRSLGDASGNQARGTVGSRKAFPDRQRQGGVQALR